MKRFTILIAPILAALLSLASIAQAADKVWTGAGATRFISDGANWQDGIAPATGDRLFFPYVAQGYVQNDIAGASFDSLTFSGNDSVYTLYGLPLTLTGSTAVSASDRSVIFIIANITFAASSPTIQTIIGLPTGDRRPAIQFSQGSLVFSGGTVEVSAPVGSVEFVGDIRETAQTSFELIGDDVYFGGNNSFTGSVTTFTRVTSVDSPTAFGTTNMATFLAGKSLDLSSRDTSELVIAEPLSLLSNNVDPIWGNVVVAGQGPVRLTGSIVLFGNQVLMPAAPLVIDGVVSGPGSLEVGRADDVVTLTNPGNSFAGGVSVTRGTFRAGNSLAIPLSSTASVSAGATLDIGQTYQSLSTFACLGNLKATVGPGEIVVNTALSLQNCALTVSVPPNYIPRSREVMTMVQNNTGLPFNAQFVGYPEGTVINVNGVHATATYFAGQGNDFAFVAEALPATALYANGGTPQSVAAGATAYPFVAVARDAFGRLAPNAPVTFTAPTGCGTFGGSQTASVTTDAQGVATSPAFTAGSATQLCFVQAQSDGGGSASFELHVYKLSDLTLTVTPASLSTIVNQPFTLSAELRANGMSLPFLAVFFQANTRGNAGVASLPSYAFTDPATSRAVVTGVANSKSGNYSIVATFGSLSVSVPVSQKGQ